MKRVRKKLLLIQFLFQLKKPCIWQGGRLEVRSKVSQTTIGSNKKSKRRFGSLNPKHSNNNRLRVLQKSRDSN